MLTMALFYTHDCLVRNSDDSRVRLSSVAFSIGHVRFRGADIKTDSGLRTHRTLIVKFENGLINYVLLHFSDSSRQYLRLFW